MAEHCSISVAAVGDSELSEKRSHLIKIHGYSRTKGLIATDQCVTSTPFCVGGHNWVVKYYPNGNKTAAGFISVFLALDSADSKDVKAEFSFTVLNKEGKPVSSLGNSTTAVLHIFPSKGSDWGFQNFLEQEDLEGPLHLQDDCFSMECQIIVMKISREETKCGQFVAVPPSNLHLHLGDLLKNVDGADVTFQIGGQKFTAHRNVLAARSSVFKAELFGAVKENVGDPIVIGDMEADVFKSLLYFIYTDSVPVLDMASDEGEDHGDVAMASHLLVAADRYNIERLKLICEDKLCKHVDSKMVATSLALAEQHSCHGLKEACLQFLASPSNVEAMMTSDGYEHLKSSCPSVLKELVARFLPAELKAVLTSI